MSVQDAAVIEKIIKWKPTRVFEYGMGGSTFYFAPMSHRWYSVEHDKEWHDAVCKKLDGPRYRGKGSIDGSPYYLAFAEDTEKYIEALKPFAQDVNLVLVDGIERVRCLFMAQRVNGVVVCHDANRTGYLPGVLSFTHHVKAGDDLFIMTNKPDIMAELIELLKEFDVRSVYDGSNPWDPRHPSGEVEYCGYQHPSTLPSVLNA